MPPCLQIQLGSSSLQNAMEKMAPRLDYRLNYVAGFYPKRDTFAYLYYNKGMDAIQAQQLIVQLEPLQAPCLVFLTSASDAVVELLVEANVSLVHVGPWPNERFSQLMQVAQARYKAIAKQQSQLKSQQQKLADVQIINQAKGKLMQQQNVSEARAHAAMQRLAMSRGVSMADIARQVLHS